MALPGQSVDSLGTADRPAEMPEAPLVAVLPYGKRLGLRPGALPLADLVWPLGLPEGARHLTLGDLGPGDHLLLSPHTALYFMPSFGTRAKVSVVVQEPRAIHARHLRLLWLFHRRFHRILTADTRLCATIPNALFFPVGGRWVSDPDRLDLTKQAMCSLIVSKKAKLPGHKLRHDLVRWCRDTGQPVDVMGRGYRPFAEKADGLAPYRYSLVLENVREPNYFTEKLVDALLCQTVPIYWGCPNIGDFFDTRGMILCDSLAEIQTAIRGMSDADYASRRLALATARAQAAGYGEIYARAARALLDDGAGPRPAAGPYA
jgi:hypothetical protein